MIIYLRAGYRQYTRNSNMIHHKLYSIIFLTFLFQISKGQELKRIDKQQKSYTISFRLTDYNNLSIQAILNTTDTVNLMFHTAASSVTLTEESVKKLKSIRFVEITDSVKSWGSQSNSSRLSLENSIRIGDLTWEKVPISENINSGQYTDGKFGIDFFKDQIIEIDFDKSVIRLHTTLPKKIKKYEKIRLTFRDDMMFLEADCSIGGSSFRNRFLVHSGYSGAILFDDKFANDNKLSDRLPITGEKILKDSYGNILKTKQAILPLLKIKNKSLINVPAGFFEGSIGRQKISIFGGDILKRFNLVIDAKREYIYLKANRLANTDYKKM
jgi:hypothetical protein